MRASIVFFLPTIFSHWTPSFLKTASAGCPLEEKSESSVICTLLLFLSDIDGSSVMAGLRRKLTPAARSARALILCGLIVGNSSLKWM